MTKKDILKRYILLNIYLGKWQPGDKIPSSQQFSIKFDVTSQTVKKLLTRLHDNGVLSSRERVGYFINENIYKMIPLSLRRKYDVVVIKHSSKLEDDKYVITKEYATKKSDPTLMWGVTYISKTIFDKLDFSYDKTLMYNLAFNGLLIYSYESEYKCVSIKNKNYILAARTFRDQKNKLIVKEDVYVPIEIWYDMNKIGI